MKKRKCEECGAKLPKERKHMCDDCYNEMWFPGLNDDSLTTKDVIVMIVLIAIVLTLLYTT